jgi:hypothetical protein
MLRHLTDDEVQLYVDDKQQCGITMIQHVHSCEECKAKVEIYQLIFKGLGQQPQPSFDFNISELVLQQLPSPATKTSNDKLLTWVFITVCVGLVGTGAYFFRDILTTMFKGIAGIPIYLIAISAITVVALMFVEMYKKNQKEMRVLDLY